MIRRAFEIISDIPTRLICFSDDVDGMRKVPRQRAQPRHAARTPAAPLTSVPDPFGEYESFGHHNNAMLRRFLDTFGFEYEFISATEFYKSGRFDDTLRLACERYDAIMEMMLASCARSGSRPIPASCRSTPRRGACCTCRSSMWTRRTRPSPSTTRRAANGPCPSRAAT
jgi:lysyl-tRNA synthetase, class I